MLLPHTPGGFCDDAGVDDDVIVAAVPGTQCLGPVDCSYCRDGVLVFVTLVVMVIIAAVLAGTGGVTGDGSSSISISPPQSLPLSFHRQLRRPAPTATTINRPPLLLYCHLGR